MTDAELNQLSSTVQKRYNEFLYERAGKSTDAILNISDIKAAYARGCAEEFSSIISYKKGDIVTNNIDIYISLVDVNLGNNLEDPIFFLKVDLDTIDSEGKKYFSAAASLNIDLAYDDTGIYFDSSFGFDYLTRVNDYVYYLSFDAEAKIFDTSYAVFCSASVINPIVFNRSKNGFYIRTFAGEWGIKRAFIGVINFQ